MKVNENNELRAKLDVTVAQPIRADKGFSQNPGKRQRKSNLHLYREKRKIHVVRCFIRT